MNTMNEAKVLAQMLTNVHRMLVEVKDALSGIDQRVTSLEDWSHDLDDELVIVGARLSALEKVLRSCDG